MKKIALFSMVTGVLLTLYSTFFTVIHKQYDIMPVILFWVLLSGFEFLFAWIWLFSQTHVLRHSQKLTLVVLIALMVVWIVIVLMSTATKPIFIWALKTLNNSGFYFLGLIIYYRERKISNND